MIARLWRGRTRAADADAYYGHVTGTVVPELKGIAGFRRAAVMRRNAGDHVEFLVMSCWESWDAIRAFAGDDPSRAVVEPRARAVLAEFDERVEHFELAFDHDMGPM